MATKWSKPVSRKIAIKCAEGGVEEIVVSLAEKGVLLRKSGCRKNVEISYEELLSGLPK